MSKKDMKEEGGGWLKRISGIVRSLVPTMVIDDPDWQGEGNDYLLKLKIDGGELNLYPIARTIGGGVILQAINTAANRICTDFAPAGVAEEDWEEAKFRAVRDLLAIYASIGTPAPPKLVALHGNHIRATSVTGVFSQVYDILMNLNYQSNRYHEMVDLLEDETGLVVLFTIDGTYYSAGITVDQDGTVTMDAHKPLSVSGSDSMGRCYTNQEEDGRYRFVQIVATSALNRVKEIDSSELFANIQRRWVNSGKPELTLDFNHLGERGRLGTIDYVLAEGNALVVSWLFDQTPIGRAAEKNCLESPDYWGNSIEYYPIKAEVLRNGEEIIPVYTDGLLVRVALCSERSAANLYTGLVARNAESMKQSTRDDLVKLLGSEALVEEFLTNLQKTEEAVSSGVHRSVDTQTEQTAIVEDVPVAQTNQPQTETAKMAETTQEFVLDESAINAIVEGAVKSETLGTMIAEAVNKALGEFGEKFVNGLIGAQVQPALESLARIQTAVDALNASEEEKKRQWLSDVPPQHQPNTRVTVRPKTDAPPAKETASAPTSLADAAQATLSGLNGIRPNGY